VVPNEEVRNMSTRAESTAYDRRWVILVALSLSLLMVIVDDTIVTVALPTLQRELGASTSALQWIVDAYIVVFAGLLLTMGSLGDRFGRKRFLQLGLLVFAGAAALGAYAPSTNWLIAARGLMGVGGALIMPSTLSILVDVFPRRERVKAIAIWTGVASLGIPLGPIVGGWLLERFWWGSAFLLNVPIAVVALVAGAILAPESRDPSPPRPDLAGLGLSIVALTALVYGIIEAPAHGWTSVTVIGSLALAIAAGAGFVWRERRAREPMLDLRLFRNARLSWGTVAMTLAGLAIGGLAFELTQYLQFVHGYSPFAAGLRVLPIAIGFGFASPITPRVVKRVGSTRTVSGALGGAAAAFGALAFAGVETPYWMIAIPLFVVGFGLGAAFVPATDAVMAAMPEANAGLGSAINDSGRQVGAALGVGVLGAVANATFRGGIDDAASRLEGSVAAMAESSIGSALEVAGRIGGSDGAALRDAALGASADAFGLAMATGAVLLAAGALVVLRRLPRDDIEVQSVDEGGSDAELVGSGARTEGGG
jgi:EmrB/QacA subfamily drug resistance transporter